MFIHFVIIILNIICQFTQLVSKHACLFMQFLLATPLIFAFNIVILTVFRIKWVEKLYWQTILNLFELFLELIFLCLLSFLSFLSPLSNSYFSSFSLSIKSCQPGIDGSGLSCVLLLPSNRNKQTQKQIKKETDLMSLN